MSSRLRRKEHDNEMDYELIIIAKKLLDSDKKFGKIDQSKDGEILGLLNEQIGLIEKSLDLNFSRFYRVVERYKQLDSKLDQRKKDADLKFNEFEADLKLKIKDEKAKGLVDKELLDKLKQERKDTHNQHKKYLEKISKLQGSISKMSDRVEGISKRSAYHSKDMSNSR